MTAETTGAKTPTYKETEYDAIMQIFNAAKVFYDLEESGLITQGGAVESIQMICEVAKAYLKKNWVGPTGD